MTKPTTRAPKAIKAAGAERGLLAPGQPDPLPVQAKPGESDGRVMARVTLEPTVRHGRLATTFSNNMFGGGRPPIVDTTAVVLDWATQIGGGDLALVSRMLTAQAVSLDAMFGELGRRSADNMGQYIDASERYMRLALKAQSNCRATLEALARLHQPREQTVKHVHVNNGGQAIVADQLHQHGGKENGKSDGQPLALTRGTDAPCQPMRSADAEREAVPIARDA
jgi:hypothetical protein